MDIEATTHGNFNVLKLVGRIDQTSADRLQSLLAPWVEDCTPQGAALVLDLSGVDYIGSVGLRALMLAAKQVKAQQGRMVAAAPTPVVAEVFQVSRFHLMLEVYTDLEAACTALS